MYEAERMRILELLEQGKITASEAAELLGALGGSSGGRGEGGQRGGGRAERFRWGFEGGPGPGAGSGAKVIRLRVSERASGKGRANVTFPIGLMGMGLGFARHFKFSGGPPIDDLLAAVRSGRRGTIYDISGGQGERIEVIIE